MDDTLFIVGFIAVIVFIFWNARRKQGPPISKAPVVVFQCPYTGLVSIPLNDVTTQHKETAVCPWCDEELLVEIIPATQPNKEAGLKLLQSDKASSKKQHTLYRKSVEWRRIWQAETEKTITVACFAQATPDQVGGAADLLMGVRERFSVAYVRSPVTVPIFGVEVERIKKHTCATCHQQLIFKILNDSITLVNPGRSAMGDPRVRYRRLLLQHFIVDPRMPDHIPYAPD